MWLNMSNRKIYASLYRVTKEFDINDETTCHIGDIILVNEDGLDGAWGDNLTQTNLNFCPFTKPSEKATAFRRVDESQQTTHLYTVLCR